MRPAEMSKIVITGPKSVLQPVIEELHRLKVFHIVDYVKQDDIDIGNTLPIASQLSEILVKIRSVCSYLNIDLKKEPNLEKIAIFKKSNHKPYSLGRISKDLYNRVSGNLEKLKKIEENIQKIKSSLPLLEVLHNLKISPEELEGYKSISVFFGTVNALEGLKIELRNITDRFELSSYSKSKQKHFIALFVDKTKEAEISEALAKFSFSQIQLSERYKGSAEKNIKMLNKKVKELEKEKRALGEELKTISDRWSDFLILNERILSREIEKAEAPLRFADFPNAFVCQGWVPNSKFTKLKQRLNKITNEVIHIEKEDIRKKEKIPVKLENKGLVKPFEYLLELYTIPKYREIDPTFFTFITFPLFFGFILGDFGYGLVTLALFLLLKKKFKTPLLDIMMVASISSMVFGLLFGEFFGEEVLFGYHLPRLLSRVHQLNDLLTIAVVIGAIHVNIGLIIGFVNELSHGIMRAIGEKLSWIILQLSVALVAIYFISKAALALYTGVAAAAISVILILMYEGIKGALEIPAIFGNILSYARLMAVGVASVFLAVIVNEFAFEFFHKGGLMIIAGVLTLLLGHAINIALGLIGGFLHSIRLHYVEFFSKFYSGGGTRYMPFGYDKRH